MRAQFCYSFLQHSIAKAFELVAAKGSGIYASGFVVLSTFACNSQIEALVFCFCLFYLKGVVMKFTKVDLSLGEIKQIASSSNERNMTMSDVSQRP